MIQLARRAALGSTAVALVALLLSGCATTSSGEGAGPEGERTRSEIYLELGMAYLRDGRPRDALRKLKDARSLNDDDARIHNALALTYQNLGFDDKAEEAFEEAVALDPDDPQVRNNYGAFLAGLGSYERAKEQFEAALQDPMYSTPEKAYYNLGWLAREEGESDRAEEMLRTALRLRADYPAARLALVRLLRDQGDLDQAQDEAEELLERRPEHPRGHLLAAELARELGDEERAADHLRRVLEVAPDSGVAEKARTRLERMGDRARAR
ncbi:MAG: type IV pilus biogenesis/stability protein PilW [Thiohalorhabdus sp.]|uniref:type IV pilus biogenesis/stability protein PilW n=1 Tax=Thiohalorhabdus sp. TaxID=3094134 RepID=UPI00398135F6